MKTYWRYIVGSFAGGAEHDHVELSFAPIGTFSTGMHGELARHRREAPPRRSIRQAAADVPTRG